MYITNRKGAIVFCLIMSLCVHAYAQDANVIINTVNTKLNRIKDYSVDVNIKVDLPFIKMLPINGKIYFKQKDKFKVVSKSIALVPKDGFVQLSKLIKDPELYTAVLQSSESVNGTRTSVINVIPLNDTGDVILGRLWIDEKNAVITKSQITTRSNGTILTDYKYGTQMALGLPDAMNFEVDIKKFKVPKAVAADINTNTAQNKKEKGKEKRGTIFIKLSNYQINKGINDEIFTQQ